MTREEINTKLKAFITCLKCGVSGKCCDDDCPTQYEAGNMGEIIENLEAISKLLEQERSRSAEITQYRHDCEKLIEENERLKKTLEQEPCKISEYDKDHIWYKGVQYISLRRVLEVKSEKKNKPCEDCISRQKAIRCVKAECNPYGKPTIDFESGKELIKLLKRMPPQVTILLTQKPETVTEFADRCRECGAKYGKALEQTRWIPVSEKLPNDRDWHLGIFKESDTGWINPLPFICDYVGHETKVTTKEHWILRGFTDRDEHIDYYFNLECVAWMQLPKPYKAESEDKQ